MSNLIDFKNKVDENKALYGFEPDISAWEKIRGMWDGTYNPVTITFDPNNIPLFERQIKRYSGCCRISHNKCDEELYSFYLKKFIKEKN